MRFERILSGCFFSALSLTAMSVSLSPEAGPSAPVGSVVIWRAAVSDDVAGPVWYRYRVRSASEPEFRTIRDFTPQTDFSWVPMRSEGAYEIEVTAVDRDTGETTSSTESYQVTSPASNGTPVINATGNELVYIYTAPACAAGSKLSVAFTAPDGATHRTPETTCDPRLSMSLYLAGLRAETEYAVQQSVQDAHGAVVTGPVLNLRTNALPFASKPTRALLGGGPGVLVQNRLFEPSIATDLNGNVIWYLPFTLQYLTRFEKGGYFFALIEDHKGDDSAQLLRLYDLAGNVVLETNAGAVNDQLEAQGRRRITSFHHEARRLADGQILVLAASEQILTDVQGPGEVDVIGDTILLLDQNLQVTWVWDSFEHMDIGRIAVADQKCTPGGGGCPVFRLAEVANDWLHGNSLAVASDGNIIYSSRHQDWVLKIDFQNGQGPGTVLWRLGKDGDFQIDSDDPAPWFSHQHDANFETGEGSNRLLVFDNGNTRRATDENAHSRGQVFQIDESARRASLVLNADLGDYALALGSAQKLDNGNYHFNLGWMPNLFSHALTYDPQGNLVEKLEIETQQYRSFRMPDLYTPQ